MKNRGLVARLALLAAVLLLLGTGKSFALTVSNASVSTAGNTSVPVTLAVTLLPSESPPPIASISSAPAHGTALVTTTSLTSVTVTYTPTAGFAGTDAFIVAVTCSSCSIPVFGTVTVAVGTAIDSSLSGMIGALQRATLLSTYAQIDNFDKHFERLHDVLRNHHALGVSINGQSSPGAGTEPLDKVNGNGSIQIHSN